MLKNEFPTKILLVFIIIFSELDAHPFITSFISLHSCFYDQNIILSTVFGDNRILIFFLQLNDYQNYLAHVCYVTV
jgi:hypothetical protein